MNNTNEISLEEIYFADVFIIEKCLSTYHHGLYKDFKKVVNNDSRDAFKINAKAYKAQLLGRMLSQEESESIDNILDYPERHSEHSSFFIISKR